MNSLLLIKLFLFAAIFGCAHSVGIYEQCAGEGYGTFPCNAGLTCFRRNKWYSSCQFSCPRSLGWECEATLPTLPPSNVAVEWDQCGGDGWLGARVCAAGFACYTRSVFYSQCRPINDCPPGWTCPPVVATTAAPPIQPIILDAYSKCNNLSNVVCVAGTTCFKFNAAYSECRSSCPTAWACETEVLGAGEQCGGEGYIGITRCAAGLNCYVRSKFYSQCAAACPGVGWTC